MKLEKVCWFDEYQDNTDNNNGYIYGIYFYDNNDIGYI